MTEQSKAEQVKTERIKIAVTVEVKTTHTDLNKKTACKTSPCCKR